VPHTAKDTHDIALELLARTSPCPKTAACQVVSDIVGGDGDTGRQSLEDSDKCRAV
jgi:hypothetical protein